MKKLLSCSLVSLETLLMNYNSRIAFLASPRPGEELDDCDASVMLGEFLKHAI